MWVVGSLMPCNMSMHGIAVHKPVEQPIGRDLTVFDPLFDGAGAASVDATAIDSPIERLVGASHETTTICSALPSMACCCLAGSGVHGGLCAGVGSWKNGCGPFEADCWAIACVGDPI